MRTLLPILAITIASFTAGGCSSKKSRFEAGATTATLNGKDTSVAITFGKKVSSVSENKEGVSARLDGDKVVFTQTADSPEVEKKVDFVIKGTGEESAVFSIILAAKPAVNPGPRLVEKPPVEKPVVEKPVVEKPVVIDPAPSGDVVLEKDSLNIRLTEEPLARAFVDIKAGRPVNDTVQEQRGIHVRLDRGRILVEVENKTSPGEYWVKVDSSEKDKKGAKLKVTVTPMSAPSPVEPFALEKNKIDVKLRGNETEDVQISVKAKSGTLVGVAAAPPASKVSWNLDPDKKAISIRVSKDLTRRDFMEHLIVVSGKDTAGQPATAELKVQLTAEPLTLDNDGKMELVLHTNADRDPQAIVKARTGRIFRVTPVPPPNGKVTWKFDADKQAIIIDVARDAAAADMRDYHLFAEGSDAGGIIRTVELNFKVAAEPFALDDNGKLKLKLHANAATDPQIWVKAKSGTIDRVVEPVPPNSKVVWKVDPEKKALSITVAKTAGEEVAKEYAITVFGKDAAGKPRPVLLKFTVVGPVEPFALEEEQLEVKADPNADRRLSVKALAGKIVNISEPPPNSKVSWKIDRELMAVAITVSKQAVAADAREYLINVSGVDAANRPRFVSLKLKVLAP